MVAQRQVEVVLGRSGCNSEYPGCGLVQLHAKNGAPARSETTPYSGSGGQQMFSLEQFSVPAVVRSFFKY